MTDPQLITSPYAFCLTRRVNISSHHKPLARSQTYRCSQMPTWHIHSRISRRSMCATSIVSISNSNHLSTLPRKTIISTSRAAQVVTVNILSKFFLILPARTSRLKSLSLELVPIHNYHYTSLIALDHTLHALLILIILHSLSDSMHSCYPPTKITALVNSVNTVDR